MKKKTKQSKAKAKKRGPEPSPDAMVNLIAFKVSAGTLADLKRVGDAQMSPDARQEFFPSVNHTARQMMLDGLAAALRPRSRVAKLEPGKVYKVPVRTVDGKLGRK